MAMSAMTRHFMIRFRDCQSGAVAVEFMLIAPMLLALMFGTVTVGYFMALSHSVQQLASGAARASVAGLDAAERQSLAETYLAQSGTRYPLLVAEDVQPAVSFESGASAGITVDIVYSIDGSILDIANSFLGLSIGNITGSAYLAY